MINTSFGGGNLVMSLVETRESQIFNYIILMNNAVRAKSVLSVTVVTCLSKNSCDRVREEFRVHFFRLTYLLKFPNEL